MKKLLFVVLISISMASCTFFGIRNSEQAQYKTLLEDGDIQVRLYSEVITAYVTSTGNYKESSNQAFRQLADYIFGNNTSQQDIAMTTPVIQQQVDEKIAMTVPVYQQQKQDEWQMSFVLPAKYTMETIPLPNNENITLERVAEKKVAAIRYSGFITQEKIDEHAEKLQQWLTAKKYNIKSAAYSAAYDPPWTIPFLRRNEVLIDIE